MALFLFLRRLFSVVYLMRHRAVPWYLKALPVIAFLYLLLPRDIVPDFRPFFGLLDDVVVISVLMGLFTSKGWQHVERERQTKHDAIPAEYEVLGRVGEEPRRPPSGDGARDSADAPPGHAPSDGATPPTADLRSL